MVGSSSLALFKATAARMRAITEQHPNREPGEQGAGSRSNRGSREKNQREQGVAEGVGSRRGSREQKREQRGAGSRREQGAGGGHYLH